MQAWLMMFKTPLRFTTLLVLLSFGYGCNTTEEAIPETFTQGEGVWPFWPMSMRFHPLTRLVIKENEVKCTLEARIEFKDLEEDISKALGQMNIKLFEMHSDGRASEIIETWDIDLENRKDNRTHYSVITRTYLFRLKLDTDKLRENMELVAKFNSADGQVFNASIILDFTPPAKSQD